jgi:hypothetical protein
MTSDNSGEITICTVGYIPAVREERSIIRIKIGEITCCTCVGITHSKRQEITGCTGGDMASSNRGEITGFVGGDKSSSKRGQLTSCKGGDTHSCTLNTIAV